MAVDSGTSNTLDYTQDIINIVNAIDDVKTELVSLNTKVNDQNTMIQTIVNLLTSMDETHADYLERASNETLGIYTNGIIGHLSRALLMTGITEERLQEVINEINNPTPLPDGQ